MKVKGYHHRYSNIGCMVSTKDRGVYFAGHSFICALKCCSHQTCLHIGCQAARMTFRVQTKSFNTFTAQLRKKLHAINVICIRDNQAVLRDRSEELVLGLLNIFDTSKKREVLFRDSGKYANRWSNHIAYNAYLATFVCTHFTYKHINV